MKITEIQFTNYKAFYGDGTVNKVVIPNGKNLLIYGENGSGKSSIYEGLKNLFLASNVTDGNAHFSRHLAVDEFITIGEGENMKTEQVPASIKIKLDDFNGNSKEVVYGTNGNVNSDKDIFTANKSNSFLSYRELLKTYLIRNVTDGFAFQVNLAELILTDILAQTTNVGTNKTYSQNYKELWVAGRGTRPSREQKEEIAKKFDIGFKKDIADINIILNELLYYFFPELKIELSVVDTYIEYETQNYPVFQIALKCWHYGIDTSKNGENHLTILNEARLSALALCIFLSGIIIKSIQKTKIKFLFFDDIFIGLDTSNRIPLLKILNEYKAIKWKEGINSITGRLENVIQRNKDGEILYEVTPFFNDYQIFITTYDRHWFEISRQYFEANKKNKWQFMELYIDNTKYDFDIPYILPYQSKLTKAEDYLNIHDYRACATYLRTLCEEELQRILPNSLKHLTEKNHQGNIETKGLILNDLLINFEKFCELENIPFEEFKFLKIHKNHLLNTLSHNDISSPIYKKELLVTLQAIKSLSSIQVIEIPNKIQDFNLFLNDRESNKITIRFKKRDTIHVYNFNGDFKISNNSNCELESSEIKGVVKTHNSNFKSIQILYLEVCNIYNIEPTHNLFDVIFKRVRDIKSEPISLLEIVKQLLQ